MKGSPTPRLFTFLAIILRLPLMVFVLTNLAVSLALLAICKGMVALFSLTTWDWGRRSRQLASGVASTGLSLYLWLLLRLFGGAGCGSSASGPESK